MGSTQQFCLKWNNHQSNMLAVFDRLLSNKSLVDVTLGCEGFSLKAHKVVLSACSPFFESLFADNPCKHPIVILKDIRYVDLKALVEFMYRGEVNVSQEQLPALLKTAEALKIKGLAEVTGDTKSAAPGGGHVPPPSSVAVPPPSLTPAAVVPPLVPPVTALPPVVTSQPHTPSSLTERPDSPRRKRLRMRRNSSEGAGGCKSDSEAPGSNRTVDAPDVLEDGSMDEDSADDDMSSKDDGGPPGSRTQNGGTNNNSTKDNGVLDDDEEGDFEPTKLLEQSMTENFTGGHDSSSAGGDSCSNAGGDRGTPQPPGSMIVPSESSLDIKPIINFDDADGNSAAQAAAAAVAQAAAAMGVASPLMFVNNSTAGPSATAGSGTPSGTPGSQGGQQSHGRLTLAAPLALAERRRCLA